MMGRLLEIFRRETVGHEINELDERSPPQGSAVPATNNQQEDLFRLSRLFRTLRALEGRCPDRVDVTDWQAAVDDGRRFLAQWGEQAEALDWPPRDLFGLAPVPEKPSGNYRRLARYDLTGLIWLLRGRPVVALTDATAAIANPSGSTLIYRRYDKPGLGPVGDSLDDLT
jgi:hypothetical protein